MMNHLIKSVGLLILLLTCAPAFSQTNKEKAAEKSIQALQIADQGKLDKAIKLYEEAIVLDPENIDYSYGMAFVWFKKKEYKKVSELLEPLVNHNDVTELMVQLLGNSYDKQGNVEKAMSTYELGLKKFPDSGRLYMEIGLIHMQKNAFGQAVQYFEKGIDVEPAFSSNYYWLTAIFCNSDEEVWGMIYGEIFLNIERNTARTAEISKLLFDTYKNAIQLTSDTSLSVSFSKEASMNVDDISNVKNIKLPFGIAVYEPTLMMAALGEKSIDINSLSRIRDKFVTFYFKNGYDKTYPNILFDFQEKVLEAGHMEAYNHWILMKGDEEGFIVWQQSNKAQWDSFVTWFSLNKLVVDKEHLFIRKK